MTKKEWMAIDCSVEADTISELLSDYGLSISREPIWLTEPETNTEANDPK